MAHFQLPHSGLFPGGTRLHVEGSSGIERLVLQTGKLVNLELAGLAAAAATPAIRQVPLASLSDLAGLFGSSAPVGPNVVIVSALTGSGTKRNFTVKADRAGLAALMTDGASPLFISSGNFENHVEAAPTRLKHDLIAGVFKASDPAKMHVLTRTLFNNPDNLFNENLDANQTFCAVKPCLPCGSVSKARGSAIFSPVDYDYQDYFKRLSSADVALARAGDRKAVKYDNDRLKRGCEAIKKRLEKGKAPVVGLVYNLSAAVQSNGDLSVTGNGGHSVPIVGCNEAATKFLYIDVYPDGSKLKYTGGHAGRDLFPGECNFLGMFELVDDAARGTKVLRAQPGTDGPSGVFAGSQFLEVVSGPLSA